MARRAWNISEELRGQIRHFPPHLKGQVWEALDEIAVNPEIGKTLTEDLEGYRSYRIGAFRLIYRIEDPKLRLLVIGPRRTVYETIVLAIARTKIKERAARYMVAKKLKRPKRLNKPLKNKKGLVARD
jgi:mRNA-degrading endonuclease RelE of RelBE toxin-antitoxin system